MKKTLFKKSALFFMTVMSFIVLMTVSASAKGEKVCLYDYMVKSYDAIIDYLDEFYLKKYPDFSLALHYGSPSDQKVIKEKAVEITKACKTDGEKVAALVQWIRNNIKYEEKTLYHYPIDVLANREANCLGTAYLLSDMLRSIGIRTAPAEGKIGSMSGETDLDYYLNKWVDHAFVMAYIDGLWTMFDPLGLSNNESDKESICRWTFIKSIEGVVPWYDGIKYVLYKGAAVNIYKNGSFYGYTEKGTNDGTMPENIVSYNYSQTFQSHIYTENNSYDYLDNSVREEKMKIGECYTDGWIGSAHQYFNDGKYSYTNILYRYIQPNGVVFGDIITKLGDEYIYNYNFRLTNEIDEYFLNRGALVVYDGEKIPFEFLTREYLPDGFEKGEDFYTNGYKVVYSSDGDSFDGSVDVKDGRIYVVKEGIAGINIKVFSPEGGLVAESNVSIFAAKSDVYCKCEYGQHVYKTLSEKEADCKNDGYALKECVGCGERKNFTVRAEKHRFALTVTEPTCTEAGTKTYLCSCGYQYTEEIPKPSHNIVSIPAISATYKKSGLTEGKKCADCGDVTVKQKKVKRLTLKKVKALKAKSIKVSDSSYVKLQWKSVKGAEKYEVYRYVNKNWKKIKTVTSTAYTVKKLTAGKTYKFKVRAVAGDNKGDFSSVYTAKIIPSKTSVTLKAEKNQLTVSWKTVSDVKGYQLMYSTSKKFTKKTTKTVAIKNAKTKKTTIKNLKKGTKYYVKVRAYKTVGKTKIYSAWSSVKNVKIK